MANQNLEQEFEQELEEDDVAPLIEIISWEIPEYQKHTRNKLWYILFGIIGIAMIIYAITTANFLFAIILIISSFILIINDSRNPQNVLVTIANEGVIVGRKFYDYDDIKNFSIVYKPTVGVKNLYIDFKSSTKHHLSIPLLDINPLFLRDNLSKYLEEDLERVDETTSESLAKILKL